MRVCCLTHPHHHHLQTQSMYVACRRAPTNETRRDVTPEREEERELTDLLIAFTLCWLVLELATNAGDRKVPSAFAQGAETCHAAP